MARNAARWLEAISFLLISGMGFWLIWQALRMPILSRTRAPALAAASTHAPETGSHQHHHDHHHNHEAGENCGCGHAPRPRSRGNGRFDALSQLPLRLASGHAPAALLVLLFSSAAGLYWAGVISTFVMALGTAVTVSAIAAAVGSRRAALAKASANSAWLDWTGFALRLGSGLVVACLGLMLFWATLHDGVVAG